MATFLKYENGLLVPVQSQKAADANDCLAGVGSNSRNRINVSYRKIYNLLIMLTVIINTILTAAAISNLS
jgi:hypothetical protein